jgi:hypothetical protein
LFRENADIVGKRRGRNFMVELFGGARRGVFWRFGKISRQNSYNTGT